MNSAVEVIAFFERSTSVTSDWPRETYVAGFRKSDGSRLGVEIVLPAELVERVVVSKCHFSLSMNPDGTFTLHADGLGEDALDTASDITLRKQSLQTLLDRCLQPDLIAMEDDPVRDLDLLRTQLEIGLGQVNRILEQLKRDGGQLVRNG